MIAGAEERFARARYFEHSARAGRPKSAVVAK